MATIDDDDVSSPSEDAGPSAAKPSAAKPSPAKPSAAKSSAAKRSTAKPGAAKAGTARPSATKPAPKTAAPKTAVAKRAPRRAPARATAPVPAPPPLLEVRGLGKRFGDVAAVDAVSFALPPGSFTGIVGPNGAGKTTTLSMITGLLRPSSGSVRVAGIDVWADPAAAKRRIGVLPDRLHLFDRLTGAQLLYYTGVLHGLDRETAIERSDELARAFRVEHAMGRLVTDYSSGMVKKIALAAALVHAPRLLVLDEPFESVDPVSAMTVVQILRDFADAGGTVVLSSHSMELVQRICDHVLVIVDGRLIADGTVDEVRGDRSLQERFLDLAGPGAESIAELTWLRRFSD